MLLSLVLLLSYLNSGLTIICPLVNHAICNAREGNHACVCAITKEEAPPPEKSCNLLLGIKSDDFPGISAEFELNAHVEHLNRFPEKKFRNLIAKKLHVIPERIVALRKRCINDDKKFALQFAVLKRDVQIEPDKSITKKEAARSNTAEEDDDVSDNNVNKIQKKTDDDDDDEEQEEEHSNDNQQSKNTQIVENAKSENKVDSSVEDDIKNSKDNEANADTNDGDDDNAKGIQNKSAAIEQNYSKNKDDDNVVSSVGTGDNDDGSNDDDDDDYENEGDDDDNDDDDEPLFDDKGIRKPYKLRDFEDASRIAKDLRVDETLEYFEDMKVEFKEVKELYNIEAFQSNNVLIFQAAFAGALVALICILGVWRAIVTRNKHHYESVEGKI